MAKGKNKTKSKKSGIQRFLDALLCCCGKRRSGRSERYFPSTERRDLAESEQIIENTTTGTAKEIDSKMASSVPSPGEVIKSDEEEASDDDEGVATERQPADPAVTKPVAEATEEGSEPSAPSEEATAGTEEGVGHSSSEKANASEDFDGLIDVRGLAVPKDIRQYRQEILGEVDTMIEDFKYKCTKYLHIVDDADLDDIDITTERREAETAVEVTSNGHTYMMHVMVDGGVQVMEALWDSASDLWYNKTYLMTYWGLELISQAAV